MLNKGFWCSFFFFFSHFPTNPQSTKGCQFINWFVILLNSNVPSCKKDNYFRIAKYLENSINYLLYHFYLYLSPREKKRKAVYSAQLSYATRVLMVTVFYNVFWDILIRQISPAFQSGTSSLRWIILQIPEGEGECIMKLI